MQLRGLADIHVNGYRDLKKINDKNISKKAKAVIIDTIETVPNINGNKNVKQLTYKWWRIL